MGRHSHFSCATLPCLLLRPTQGISPWFSSLHPAHLGGHSEVTLCLWVPPRTNTCLGKSLGLEGPEGGGGQFRRVPSLTPSSSVFLSPCGRGKELYTGDNTECTALWFCKEQSKLTINVELGAFMRSANPTLCLHFAGGNTGGEIRELRVESGGSATVEVNE